MGRQQILSFCIELRVAYTIHRPIRLTSFFLLSSTMDTTRFNLKRASAQFDTEASRFMAHRRCRSKIVDVDCKSISRD